MAKPPTNVEAVLCSARGCIDLAEGMVSMPYTGPIFLCGLHLLPVRRLLLTVGLGDKPSPEEVSRVMRREVRHA